MKKLLILLLISSFIAACNNTGTEETTQKETKSTNEYMVLATNWYQQSAEMRAIYYQSFNLAKVLVVVNKNEQLTDKKPAVVLDIDETLLNNSPFQGKAIETGIGYNSETWKAWTDEAKAEPLPGAIEFLNYAKEQGVEVFYISNRKVNELGSTMENMKEKGFPNVDSSFIFLKKETSDKTERRAKVSENYEIILFVGDNLTDYSEIYAKRGEDMGFDVVDENKNDFGKKFIILPNPMYGEWESAIYKNSYKWTTEQKDSLRKSVILSY